jgi:hypothetical protein
MALNSALFVVTAAKLATASPGHAAGAVRPTPMPRCPCLPKAPSRPALPLSRALPPSPCLCRAGRPPWPPLGSSSATTVSTALPLFALDCRYHRLLLAPLCARSRSLEPASSRTIIAPVWAATAQHASGQAAVPYPGTGGASRGCAVFAWCRTAILTGHAPHSIAMTVQLPTTATASAAEPPPAALGRAIVAHACGRARCCPSAPPSPSPMAIA